MNPTTRRPTLRTILGTGLALGLALATAAPAMATSTPAAAQTLTYKVQASAVGQTGEGTLKQDVDATAPATVAAGASFDAVITPAESTLPSQVSGYTLTDIKNAKLIIPVPANATLGSATLSGGSGLGDGKPTIARDGNNVVLSVPGPIKGGAKFTLPVVTLHLTAGNSGTVVVKVGGTSYDDPGLTFAADISVSGLPVTADAKGYPDPNPTLTSTTIG